MRCVVSISPCITERIASSLRLRVLIVALTGIGPIVGVIAESAPGISGLETLLPLTLRLVEEKLLSLAEAIARLTVRPAQILGVECGTLNVGATADVCIFDPKAHWTLSPDKLVSRGRNTPFLGWEFTGRVTHTLVGGEVVFEAGAH